jgi:hypothetical protein
MISEGRDAIEIYREANVEARSSKAPAYFDEDAFADAEPPSSAEVLESLTSAFARATSNITACKSQLAGARAQLEAEYHSFYDDELTPFLKGIADAATVSVRTEFVDPDAKPERTPRISRGDDDTPEDDEAMLLEQPRETLSFKRRRGSR